ncbi:MAG: hypothetical protein AAF531_07690 [Actinomycetota bacterium]
MNRYMTSAGQAVADLAENYAEEGRVSRGRTLFRKGSVTGMSITEGSIIASVRGSGGDEYETTVGAAPPSKSVVRQVLDTPQPEGERLVDRLIDDGVDLCPPERDLGFSCSCADWDEFCKHVVAVLLAFADRVDLDEAELLRWRGLDQPRGPERSAVTGQRRPDVGDDDRRSRRDAARAGKRTELEALLGDTAVRVSNSGGLETPPEPLDPAIHDFLGVDWEPVPLDLDGLASPEPLFTDAQLGPLGPLGDLGPALADAIRTIATRLTPRSEP